MPRRWLTSLLFVLALTVQVFTPVANGVAASRGVDIHGLSEICLNAGGAGHDRQSPGRAHSHHDCALCQAFCDGVAPVASRFVNFGRSPVQWTEVRWTFAERALPGNWRDFARQARAPPSFS